MAESYRDLVEKSLVQAERSALADRIVYVHLVRALVYAILSLKEKE